MVKRLLFTISLILILAAPAMALPFLQLDISDGVYDTVTETVVATSSTFTLYALVDSKNDAELFTPGTTYYIAAAVSPKLDTPMDLGSFTIDFATVDATGDMTYGTPPIEDVAKSKDLPGHGIYETYFFEFSFTLDPTKTALAYNSQDNPGGFVAGDGPLYYEDFLIDVSGFSSDYSIHFDLYTKNEDNTIDQFAPFSHDAQSTPPVPEPATLLLLGTGMIGLIGVSRRKFRKK